MQLADLLDTSLVGQRDDIGIEYDTPGGTAGLTFGDLGARSHRLARLFERRGLAAGDRLAVYLSNRVEFVDVVLACLRLGVVLVPINVLYRQREIAHIVSDAEPRAVVATRADFPLFGPLSNQDPPAACLNEHHGHRRSASRTSRDVLLWDAVELSSDASRESAAPVRKPIEGHAPAALVYTSGTTGRSKGAILSHDNFLANAANLVACWRITSADRYLAVLPLFHVHGLGNGLMTWLASGCRMRLVERFEVSRAAELFGVFAPTLFFGVPTIYVRLLELDATLARSIAGGMRLFVSGSAPLPGRVFEAFEARFGHAILERYGMSETLMNLSNPIGGERRAGSVGFPLPGVSARIVDAHGADVAAGVTGELLVRGPNVFSGYWRQPETTAASFIGDWFRTGDLAERAADGYYTLRGRRTDVIISGGFNIYPREIEDLLLEAPGIREAAVVGAADDRRGELPIAYIVADTAVDVAALEASCRRALASFKVPRAFVQVDALPRTALGKVQKHLLPPWPAGAS